MRRRIGSGVRVGQIEGLRHYFAPVVENALPAALTHLQPDIVVVSSVDRWTWRNVRETCIRAGIPTILYVREDLSLSHVDNGWSPTRLVANAESLTARLRQAGYPCEFIPSVVDTSLTNTNSTRQVVLAINPDPTRGSAMFWELAERLPTIPFVMQEAWPLKGGSLKQIREIAERLPNVEFRRRVPSGPLLYRDAKILLVPYRVDNRPRVILEAQANGIPVIIGQVPALVEAAGMGGVSVPLEDADAWAKAIQDIWEDDALYAGLAKAAYQQSRRPDIAPAHLTDQFESVTQEALNNSE
jgi:glycosyltransferase involved in cell wall biosynthesis